MEFSIGIDRLEVPLARFASWWTRELRAMLPAALVALLRRRPSRLVVSLEHGGFTLIEESRGACTVLQEARADDKDGLAAMALRIQRATGRWRAPIRLRLARKDCYIRELTLPAAPRARLAAVLAVDLQRTLPPAASDVVWGWTGKAHPDLPGKLRVEQVVIKRPLLEAAIADLAEAGIDVGSADCWRDATSAFDVDLLAPRNGGGEARAMKVGRILLALTALLGGVAPFIALGRQHQALAAIELRIEQSKAVALAARAEASREEGQLSAAAAILGKRRGRPLAVELWLEATRLLPDDAFAEELVIEGETLSIIGKARAAARLVTAIEASPLLADAGLASAVVFDPQAGLERFNISARILVANGGAGARDTP